MRTGVLATIATMLVLPAFVFLNLDGYYISNSYSLRTHQPKLTGSFTLLSDQWGHGWPTIYLERRNFHFRKHYFIWPTFDKAKVRYFSSFCLVLNALVGCILCFGTYFFVLNFVPRRKTFTFGISSLLILTIVAAVIVTLALRVQLFQNGVLQSVATFVVIGSCLSSAFECVRICSKPQP